MTLKEVSLENRPQDARGCLDAILAARRESAAAQVRELQMVTEFADCYSWVDDPRLVVSTHGETLRQVASDGTPGVAEFAVLELSTRLGVSRESAMSLLCDALNLRHRLPGIWRLMDAGKLPVWQARRFAVVTSGLTLAQALAVDARLAASADARCSTSRTVTSFPRSPGSADDSMRVRKLVTWVARRLCASARAACARASSADRTDTTVAPANPSDNVAATSDAAQ